MRWPLTSAVPLFKPSNIFVSHVAAGLYGVPRGGVRGLMSAATSHHRPLLAIAFMCGGMFCISINDMVVKSLSGDYPLHQLIFLRSFVAMSITLVFLWMEGGFRELKVDQPHLHGLRALLIMIANSCFYAALVAMPLAMATAIYFVAPLFVTLLAIPVLGERVGPRRIAAKRAMTVSVCPRSVASMA